MSREKSQPQTPLQKLRAKQRQELSKYPRGSKEKSRARERFKSQAQTLKEQQKLLTRARAALPKSQRKKLKPVRSLSPESIRKQAAKIKNEGTKLKQPPRNDHALKPPKEGYTTQRSFAIPSQTQQMRLFVNKVFHIYSFTGNEDGHIRGIRAIIEFANGSVMSTGILEPTYMASGDSDSPSMFFVGNASSSDPGVDPAKLKVRKITVIVSWNRDYIHDIRR
jgi:hypothetical protein